jgi:2-alkenal reductase
VVNIEVATMMGAEVTSVGRGSGFLIDNGGHIVTNSHVVERADSLWVTFSDGSVREAEVLGTDPDSDLAVLLVENLPPVAAPLALGDSDALEVGQRVVAIGNPFGLQGTMTVGIISALGRALRARDAPSGGRFANPEIVQTDTAINPGNSGGPLLDSHGRVVGVNTAIQTTDGSSRGIGFAVPVNTVKRIVPYLIEQGEYRYPYLGLTENDEFTLAQLAPMLGLPTTRGLLVSLVEPGGPADRAGIRGGDREVEVMGRVVRVGGDIVIAVDGREVESLYDLTAYLVHEKEVGDTVTLTVLREGRELEVAIQLGERP